MRSSVRTAVTFFVAAGLGAAIGWGIYLLSLTTTPIYDPRFQCPQPSPLPTMPWAMSSCAAIPIGHFTAPAVWSDAAWYVIGGIAVGLVVAFVAMRYVTWYRGRLTE